MLLKPKKIVPLSFDLEEHKRNLKKYFWINRNGSEVNIAIMPRSYLSNAMKMVEDGRIEVDDIVYQTMKNQLERLIKTSK